MEALALKLRNGIDIICGGYHYYKIGKVLEAALELAEDIQNFCGSFLQGNIYNMEEEEYEGLRQYVLQILEEYVEAVEQQDLVYMLDTLDYGLRELLNIYIDEEAEEMENGEGNI